MISFWQFIACMGMIGAYLMGMCIASPEVADNYLLRIASWFYIGVMPIIVLITWGE